MAMPRAGDSFPALAPKTSAGPIVTVISSMLPRANVVGSRRASSWAFYCGQRRVFDDAADSSGNGGPMAGAGSADRGAPAGERTVIRGLSAPVGLVGALVEACHDGRLLAATIGAVVSAGHDVSSA